MASCNLRRIDYSSAVLAVFYTLDILQLLQHISNYHYVKFRYAKWHSRARLRLIVNASNVREKFVRKVVEGKGRTTKGLPHKYSHQFDQSASLTKDEEIPTWLIDKGICELIRKGCSVLLICWSWYGSHHTRFFKLLLIIKSRKVFNININSGVDWQVWPQKHRLRILSKKKTLLSPCTFQIVSDRALPGRYSTTDFSGTLNL